MSLFTTLVQSKKFSDMEYSWKPEDDSGETVFNINKQYIKM